jgi:lactoylglutathione lyase
VEDAQAIALGRGFDALMDAVGYVVLYVRHLETSVAFYREVVGLTFRLRESGYAEFATRGTKFALFERARLPGLIGREAAEGGPGKEVVFLVDDVHVEAKRLHGLGVEILAGPIDHQEFVFGRRTIRHLTSDLNARGIPSARGRNWSSGMISGLLDNPKYTGYQVWNRRRRKSGGNRANPESEWVWSAEPSHAALVPKEVWERAWRMRRTPERDWRRRSRGALFVGRPLKGLVFCCDYRMSATQRVRKSGKVVILWQCQKCRSWPRDDQLMELVVDVVCSELLDPLRVALLERQLRAAFRSRQKASLKGRTQLERRRSELHEEKLAKLDGLLHGIDPALISEAIDRLSENESRVRDELSRMIREPDEQNLLTSASRLRQAGPELSAALLSGPEELRRRILSRLVKEVTYLKEDRNIEVTLVLPHPDVPLRLAAPDDLSAPGGPEERVPDRQCPGWDSNPHVPFGTSAFKAHPSASSGTRATGSLPSTRSRGS